MTQNNGHCNLHKGVSVVVASHRKNNVPDLIHSLQKAAEKVDFPTQIIVVADYPTDEIKQERSSVTWIFVDDKSISRKRNCGVKNAQYEIIAFVDDDCKVDAHWLHRGYTFLTEMRKYCGVEGKTTIETDSAAPAMINQYKRLEKPGYRTNNIFYRKSNFLSVGGFDERFTVQREDLDLAFSLLENGEKIAFDSRIKVTHRFRKGEWWDLLKNCSNRRFDPLLYRKHKVRFRAQVGSPFSGSLLVLLVAHVAAIASLWGVAAHYFILADLFLVSVLTMRRAGRAALHLGYFIKEWVAVFAAPFVITSALLYGSFKYRMFLFL